MQMRFVILSLLNEYMMTEDRFCLILAMVVSSEKGSTSCHTHNRTFRVRLSLT